VRIGSNAHNEAGHTRTRGSFGNRSRGEYKQTRVLRPSPSAESIPKLGSYQVAPAQVKLTLCIGGNRDNEITVSAQLSREELRRVVSTHLGGRCEIEPDQFPLRYGTELRVIPVQIPSISEDAVMDTVVPYIFLDEHCRPVAVLPDTPPGFLAQIAANYMEQPCKVTVEHYPINHILHGTVTRSR
jgi:hypothetical protein